MKKLLFFLPVMAAFLAAGCTPSVKERRLAVYRQQFESYSHDKKADIREGKVRVGMSREQVYLARGVPAAIWRASESPEVEERWTYYGLRGEKLVIEFQRGSVTGVRDGGP